MDRMARASQPQTTLAVELERSLALVDDATTGAEVPGPARAAARSRAISLFGACGASSDTVPLVQLAYAGELMSLVAVDLAANPAHARRLIAQIDQQAGVPAVALGREMLQTGRLLELPAEMAIEIRLALLLAFTGARSVGLWAQRGDGQLELVSQAGQLDDELAESSDAAQRFLDGDEPGESADVPGARIERLNPPPAVLVATGASSGASHAALLIGAAVPVLSALLDRGSLDAREDVVQESVMSSVERRLARLRFDLHDGPQQDIHLLAQDLSLFREQVRPMIAGNPDSHRLLGRLDDLEAQLVALDGDLRRLSSAVQSPFLTPDSLSDALQQLTDAFATRTGVHPDTEITGPLPKLSDSQQITLLALIREALSNIRKHSNAGQVSITISSDAQGIRAVITDDGEGFDPEEMLVRAARAGRLGLVGMHERVRMLGGRTHIESRSGGPTVISATLPPFPRPES
jgi:signal transduction histidine kinase